jgi:hypothetical protein
MVFEDLTPVLEETHLPNRYRRSIEDFCSTKDYARATFDDIFKGKAKENMSALPVMNT